MNISVTLNKFVFNVAMQQYSVERVSFQFVLF